MYIILSKCHCMFILVFNINEIPLSNKAVTMPDLLP